MGLRLRVVRGRDALPYPGREISGLVGTSNLAIQERLELAVSRGARWLKPTKPAQPLSLTTSAQSALQRRLA